jgi:uncharacterized RDD family membrane protein YckC
MKCQNCEAEAPEEAERCEKCGAKLLNRRVVLGIPRSDAFTLTAETAPEELDEPGKPDDDWAFPARATAMAPQTQPRSETEPAIRYGGFFRRLAAFCVDALSILLLSALLAVMALVGYKVGLAAHGRMVSWDNAQPLIFFLTTGWTILATTYFVLYHGMEGQTIGKWMFGLRLVGSAQQPISYRRALLRWFGTIGLAGASMGLSILWILWSGEKRAWHDYLARTWVIRE